ncbi:MAG: preprotein translocase subunit SecE, partial [bacterium]|nr:preprotein translocase subunit SecE [bacterium]
MATKRKKPSATKKSATSEQPKITRIKAKDTPKAASATAATKQKQPVKKAKKNIPVLSSIGGYFVGAWKELRQVHWPNRKSTWGLTIAV